MKTGKWWVLGSGIVIIVVLIITTIAIFWADSNSKKFGISNAEKKFSASVVQKWQETEKMDEYILNPGESKKIKIGPGLRFRIYSPDPGVKAINWAGEKMEGDHWLGRVNDANFTLVNEGEAVAKVTVVLQKK